MSAETWTKRSSSNGDYLSLDWGRGADAGESDTDADAEDAGIDNAGELSDFDANDDEDFDEDLDEVEHDPDSDPNADDDQVSESAESAEINENAESAEISESAESAEDEPHPDEPEAALLSAEAAVHQMMLERGLSYREAAAVIARRNEPVHTQ